jgi:hypothetical protein
VAGATPSASSPLATASGAARRSMNWEVYAVLVPEPAARCCSSVGMLSLLAVRRPPRVGRSSIFSQWPRALARGRAPL